jgi:hypothetical protein
MIWRLHERANPYYSEMGYLGWITYKGKRISLDISTM